MPYYFAARTRNFIAPFDTASEIFGKSIVAFPNPVDIDLNLQIDSGIYNVSIYNIRGQLMLNKDITGNDTFNLQSLAKGIYVLKVLDIESKKTYQKKFIKR